MKDKELKERLKKLRESLGNSGGQITDESIQNLKQLTSETKKQQNNSALTNIKNSIDSNKVLSQASQVSNSDVVDRAIEKTLNSILNPMKLTFTRECSRYIDAISADRKTIKKIPRTVSKKSIKKLENGVFVPASNDEEKVINPEFKQLLSTGFKPKDIQQYEKKRDELFPFFKAAKDNKEAPPDGSNPFTNVAVSIADPEIGDPNNDFIKNFLGGNEPGERIEEIPIVQQKYGSMFIDSLDITPEQISYKETTQFSEVNLKGLLKTNIETKQFLPITNTTNPNWDINYKEQGNKFFLTIKNNYKYSKKSGLLPNNLTYRLVGNVDNNSLNERTKNKIDDINKGDKCNVQSNKELFSYLFKNKLNGLIDERQIPNLTEQEEDQFIKYLKNNHDKLIKSFIQDVFEETTKNRLLQEFKMSSPVGDTQQKNDLILLNLINFIPETSEELRACGKTIHPLNTDEVVRIMKSKFDSIGLQTFPSNTCTPSEEPKNAITEASFLGSAILLIRISVFEYILRNLIIFDELGYSKTVTQSSLIKEYISLLVKKELEDLSIYEEIEDIIEESYDLLKENNIIKNEDEVINSDIFSSLVNDSKYEHASDKMKSLINAMFRKTMNYLKKLLGATNPESRNELDILSNNVYNLNNANNINNSASKVNIDIEQLLKNKISNISRLDEKAKNSNFSFILEKFIIDKNNNHISFEDCADLLSKKEIEPTSLSLRLSMIIKTGRIHKIPKTVNLNNPIVKATEDLKLTQFLNNTKNIFYYNGRNTVKIKPAYISSRKNYVFYDYNINFNKDQVALVHYNSIPIEGSDISLNVSQILKYGSNKENILKALNEEFILQKEKLINILEQKPDYQIIIRKGMMSDKIINLLSFFSYCALSTEEMESLFSKSKFKLKQLITAAKNIDNYAYQNETDLKGGDAALYENDFQNTGNPNGSGGFDLLQFLITTPILILKGITQVMDPNIAIASQIVNAASAGLLFPKVDEQGNVQYPGDPFILPTALASMALLPINLLPPGFGIGPPVTPLPGMLYWALEPLLWKLPFFQNQAAKSSDAKKLKNDPKYRGFNVGSENFSCDKDQDDI